MKEGNHLIEVAGSLHCRKAVKKNPPVALCHQAWITDHQHTTVVYIANQATYTLFEGNHGVWKLFIQERIAALLFQGLDTRLPDRVTRRGKG